ncbi:retinoblastoma-associated protein [Thalassophryne amazonica]|uniref:retinoblastoma-associated protein n=1 Tax=Thalassophryne amazonica TaxID=390379 RepID=UPI001470F8A0|nr:retinoblastoma-associated protein [Thalassophryne amazonica]XP_034034546.1 retinoblastoma-associated protein [Thalassophryne amazonica]
MPPKKRNSATTQSKELRPNADIVSADRKESPDLSAKKHRDKDAEFVFLCKSLHVTDTVCDRAWALWKAVQDSMDQVPDNSKKVWGACLFVAVTDMDVTCFTLTQVQKAVNLNVKEFFSLVKKLDVNLDTISTRVDSVLTRLENKYEVMLALYQRFEKTCKKIFALDSDDKERETIESCWTMFLLAKGKALQMEDDLVISFQLLLCVLEFFIKRCPPDLLQPPYQSAISKAQGPPTRTSRRNQSKAKLRPVEPELDVQLLETLCEENGCSAEEVKNVYQTSFLAFLDSTDLSRSPDCPQVKDLSQQYEELYLRSRDFDGRLFLEGDETLAPKINITEVERTPKKNLLEDQVLIPPQTPVRAALNSIQQLRGDLTSSGDQPSMNLATYFKNCTIDPTQDVLKRVEMLGQTFSQKFGHAVGPRFVVLGKQRFTLGVRLYYRVMESMLKSEEKRLSVQNFSKLLNDSTFHTSLLACALEVVMATYRGSSCKPGGHNTGSGTDSAETDLCFPWILDMFNLAAFDFYKVIESFIKAEPTLSRDIVKHLETCEHLIMESIAWRTGSPLFELLKQAHEEGAAEQVEAAATFNQPLQHNHTAADLYLSPVRPGLPGLPVLPPDAAATPSLPSASHPPTQSAAQTAGHSRPPKSNSLSLFYKKLYRLSYMRLKTLCSYLLCSHTDLEPIIWTLFQHTLQHEYELMKDRHLDQLMMSAMYAICKVKNVDLRFKTIVTAYKNMPNTNQETFKHVLITDDHYDSIIVFYNQVFMQKLKTNILQYASTRPPTLSPIPQIPRSPYKFPSSPLRVPGSNNVYISPLKSPRMSPGIMTPRSRMLVSIGESFGPSNRFQKINQMVNSNDRAVKRTLDHGATPKPLKRLKFDVDGQDEADGSKSGGESTLIQKLAEMSSTRTRMQEQKMKEDAEPRKE